jgi:hypothetical protein
VTLETPSRGSAFRLDGRGSGAALLQKDGSLLISGVPERVWAFEVSGYLVLRRWLEARAGEALDATLLRSVLDLTWRLSELVELFDAADILLAKAIDSPLRREDIGLLESVPGRGMGPEPSAQESEEV